jgi:hypothetical protein
MQTQHVRYFLVVYDELNFTRAAKKCGVSQPSLTNAVKRLERGSGAHYSCALHARHTLNRLLSLASYTRSAFKWMRC